MSSFNKILFSFVQRIVLTQA